MLTGKCLCHTIQFQINKPINIIYQCHCSLCRKQSGTHANHASMVKSQYFQWIQGQENIITYKKDTGFTSCFCQKCGSPVPNQIGQTTFIWIPLGLIDSELSPVQTLHFCVNSKANWECTSMNPQSYEHLPHWDEIEQFFES